MSLTSRFAFVLFALLISASQPVLAADKWLAVNTKNFQLVGNANESQIKRIARTLEEFRSALALLFPKLNEDGHAGTTVIVFKSDTSFRPYKPLYQGKPANVAGYFQSGEDVNYIVLTAGSQTPHVIYHEFVHQLTRDAAGQLPLWALEGLAEVYGTFEIHDGGKEMILGRALGPHVATLRESRKLLRLPELFAVQHGSPHYNEASKQGIFYAQSWGTAHYLMLGNDGSRRPQFAKYLNLTAGGKSIEESFQEAFNLPAAALEREIADYMNNRLTWPALRFRLKTSLEFERDLQTTTISGAEAQYFLGDLLLHTNRLEEAESHLNNAVSLNATFAGSYASLGLLRVRQQKYEEALEFLTQAVNADSQNHLAHYYYAYTLQKSESGDSEENRNAKFETMRTHLKKAIALAPRFIAAYSMLGYVNLVLNEELDETETAIKKALTFAPGRPELLRLLADIDQQRDYARSLDEYRRRMADLDSLEPVREKEEAHERTRVTRQQEISKSKTESATGTETPQVPVTRQRRGREVEGLLTLMDCSKGLTMRVRAGNGFFELHTDDPGKIEFTSYTAAVKSTVACGPVKPEIPVVITYRASTDPRYLGEPLVVEFVEKKY